MQTFKSCTVAKGGCHLVPGRQQAVRRGCLIQYMIKHSRIKRKVIWKDGPSMHSESGGKCILWFVVGEEQRSHKKNVQSVRPAAFPESPGLCLLSWKNCRLCLPLSKFTGWTTNHICTFLFTCLSIWYTSVCLSLHLMGLGFS